MSCDSLSIIHIYMCARAEVPLRLGLLEMEQLEVTDEGKLVIDQRLLSVPHPRVHSFFTLPCDCELDQIQ